MIIEDTENVTLFTCKQSVPRTSYQKYRSHTRCLHDCTQISYEKYRKHTLCESLPYNLLSQIQKTYTLFTCKQSIPCSFIRDTDIEGSLRNISVKIF